MRTHCAAIALALGMLMGGASVHAADDMTVRFRAVDPAGDPIAGAAVFWVPYTEEIRTTLPQEYEQSTTDTEGYCTIDFSKHPDAALNNFEVRIENGSSDAAFIRVYPKRGYDDTVVLTVRKQVPLHGVVRDSNGNPVEGVLIGSRWFLRAKSDAEGRFTLWGQGNGANTISVYKEGYAWTSFHANPGDMDILLQPGYTIQFETVDTSGNPLANALIRYDRLQGVTNAQGRMETVPMAKGAEVNASAWWRDENSSLMADRTPIRVTGASPQDERLELHPQTPMETVSISGRVAMADNRGAVQTRLLLDYNLPDFDYSARKRAVTDELGAFRIQDLSKRIYYIRARPVDSTFYGVDGIVKVDCTNGPVENLVLNVAPGCAITGRLTMSDGSEPERQWVSLRHGNATYQSHSETGDFQFPNLPPAPATATLSASGTEMTVALNGPGEVTDDVTLELMAKSDMGRISGAIVDSAGEPQPGASFHIRVETGKERPAFISGETDGTGHFEELVETPGTASLERVNTYRQITVGNLSETRAYEYTVVDAPPPFQVGPGITVNDLRIVTEAPEVSLITGTVRDQHGNPLTAQLQVLSDTPQRPSVQQRVADGAFVLSRLPEEPFALEFTKDGHQARILQVDRDFQRGDRTLEVVLPSTPYPDEIPIWTVITGTPWTQEVVDATIQSEYIRRQFDQYRRAAATETPPERPRPRRPSPPETYPVHVVDAQGAPVTRTTAQAADVIGAQTAQNQPGIEEILPAAHQASQVLTSENGEYDVPVHHLIWGDGTCRQFVGWLPEGGAPQRKVVTLYPKRTLTIHVKNWDDEAVAGIGIGPLETYNHVESQDYARLPRTNEVGVCRIDWLPPGDYTLLALPVRYMNNERWAFQAVVPQEKDAEVTVRVGPYPPDSGNAHLAALAKSWDEKRRELTFLELWQLQPSKQRRKIERAAMEQLSSPVLTDLRSLPFLARVVEAARLKKATADLKRHYLATTARYLKFEYDHPLPQTVAALEGDGAIPFFLATSRLAHLDHRERIACILAMNRIDSTASLNAWIDYVREARALPGAPQAQEAYTHAERMAEALGLIHCQIFGTQFVRSNHTSGAQVDEDYRRGTMYFAGTEFHFVRRGDQWLPIDIGMPAIH